MTGKTIYKQLIKQSLHQGAINPAAMLRILNDRSLKLLPLLQAAWQVKKAITGTTIKIHVLNNIRNGNCSEDCHYCAQSRIADNTEQAYPMKNEAEILAEAEFAYQAGAFRHCMVFSGKDLRQNELNRICAVVTKIKAAFPMEICVSAGFITPEEARQLKAAGVDRYNHNLNTSRSHYPQVCTSHNYQDRLDTIHAVKASGLDLCSGVIIGMGESDADIIEIINELHEIKPDSIPVNFFIPVAGHQVEKPGQLSPEFCLRVLVLFRLALPATELRIAAGREYHLRSLQPLCLYAVNSLFAKGYLTTGGDSIEATKAMIRDCGFGLAKIEY